MIIQQGGASQVELVVKKKKKNKQKPPADAGDVRNAGSVPGVSRSPGEGNSNPLQYSCLGNSMDRGAWWATVHRVAESWAQLKQLTVRDCMHIMYTHI